MGLKGASSPDMTVPMGVMAASAAAQALAIQSLQGAMPTFPEFEFTYNLAVTIALVGGVIDRDITGITGLLATDRLLELQPLADLPASVGIGGQRITGAGALRVRFFTPIAIALSSTPINFRLTVKRAG